MSKKHHIYQILLVVVLWGLFFLVGIPFDYYLAWSIEAQVLLTLIAFFAIVPVAGAIVLVLLGGDYVRKSLWLAFYASCIPFALDYIVTGIIGGRGLGFVFSHWFLSSGYIYVWFELPVVGLALKKFKQVVSTSEYPVAEI
jgi:hypothetical protein